MKKLIHFTLLCLTMANVWAQADSTRLQSQKSLLQQSILPATLLLSGVLLSDSRFEKSLNRETRKRVGNDFDFPIDEYTRFAPTTLLYVADLAGLEAKNHWFDQTKNMAISIVLTDIITNTLKRSIYKVRPNGFNAKAFPSGHSSLTFATAEVLYEEFNHSNPVLAYSGYGFAAVTGSFRMLNNKHWLSDVLAGAGIGILVTKLVYHLDYLFKWNPFLKSKNINLVPRYSDGTVGLYFSTTF
ncbi:MAG: phosphatase PAP2 family protein [Pricia sp.]|nr:phosphatase PAP2 family protein [Pricia sp.]